jgi:hypothetical protein
MKWGFVHRGGSQLGHQQGAAQQAPLFRMTRAERLALSAMTAFFG